MDWNQVGEWRPDEMENQPPAGSQSELPREKVPPGFFPWLCWLCTRTVVTLKQSIPADDEPRYLTLAGFLVGVGQAVSGLVNSEITETWGISIFYMVLGGFLYGGIHYYFGGSIYHVLTRLTGGKGRWRDSQAIYIYASLPGKLVFNLAGVIYLLLSGGYGGRIFYLVTSFGFFITLIFMMLIQMKILFAGAIHLQGSGALASFLVFIILPFLYNLMTLVSVFSGIMR